MESVFDKTAKKSMETSISGKSKYLSQKIEEDFGFALSDRNINRYYKGYITREKKKIKPNKATLNALAGYIGYCNFEDFIRKNETGEEEVIRKFSAQTSRLYRQLVISFVVNIILIGGLLFFISKYYKKNCMIWIDDHYEKIRCSGLELETGLNQQVLEKFKKNSDH